MRKIMRVWLAVILALVFWSAVGYALTMEQGTNGFNRTLQDYIKDYVDIPEGAIDWRTIGKTREINVEGKDKDGYDFQYYKPDFPPEIQALNGKEIKIKGFMFPLDPTDNQTWFLFGPFPINCPYQYHVGPSLVLEAHADDHPVKFSYDPIILTGTLELVPLDTENQVFYRLRNARQIKE